MSFPSCFAKQDICSAINNNRLSKALFYFLPKYTFDKKGREMNFVLIYEGQPLQVVIALPCGEGEWNKIGDVDQMLVFHHIPCGRKVDKVTGSTKGLWQIS
jgi:hypothetical protein